MKKFNLNTLTVAFALTLAFSVTSCMKDDIHWSNSGNTSSSGTTNGSTNNTNQGSNAGSAVQAAKRLEMPKLASGNSVLLVHALTGGEINFCTEYDKSLKSTRWTAYAMYQSNSKSVVSRWENKQNQYPFDPLLSNSDYYSSDPFTNSGYSHGHLCPSADRKADEEAQRQTFFITNMMPQTQINFNATPGPWGSMEDWTRAMWKKELSANSLDTLFICRGGTIDKADQIKGKTPKGLIVPKYFYSVELLKYKTSSSSEWKYKAIGFWIEHKAVSVSSMKSYVKSVREIENLTGLNFFCNLPQDIQDKVETVSGDDLLKLWSFL